MVFGENLTAILFDRATKSQKVLAQSEICDSTSSNSKLQRSCFLHAQAFLKVQHNNC